MSPTIILVDGYLKSLVHYRRLCKLLYMFVSSLIFQSCTLWFNFCGKFDFSFQNETVMMGTRLPTVLHLLHPPLLHLPLQGHETTELILDQHQINLVARHPVQVKDYQLQLLLALLRDPFCCSWFSYLLFIVAVGKATRKRVVLEPPQGEFNLSRVMVCFISCSFLKYLSLL